MRAELIAFVTHATGPLSTQFDAGIRLLASAPLPLLPNPGTDRQTWSRLRDVLTQVMRDPNGRARLHRVAQGYADTDDTRGLLRRSFKLLFEAQLAAGDLHSSDMNFWRALAAWRAEREPAGAPAVWATIERMAVEAVPPRAMAAASVPLLALPHADPSVKKPLALARAEAWQADFAQERTDTASGARRS
jgi:hypothetical protein